MALGDENLGNLLPLLASGVDSGRVVGAGVEEEDGLSGRRAKEIEEGRQVETDGLGVVVGVVDGSTSDAVEDGLVVGCGKARLSAGDRDRSGRSETDPR